MLPPVDPPPVPLPPPLLVPEPEPVVSAGEAVVVGKGEPPRLSPSAPVPALDPAGAAPVAAEWVAEQATRPAPVTRIAATVNRRRPHTCDMVASNDGCLRRRGRAGGTLSLSRRDRLAGIGEVPLPVAPTPYSRSGRLPRLCGAWYCMAHGKRRV